MLLAENSPWPPRPWNLAYNAYAENEAWYLGDTEKLANVYLNSQQVRPTHQHEGRDMQGGLVGAVSRFFWGRAVPVNQSRTRLHIPAPADLASLSSDLMFSEPPEVQLARVVSQAAAGNVTASITPQQARLDLIANSARAHATWNEMGELKAVFGAAAIVTAWDLDVSDHVWLQTAAADVIIPEFRSGRLSALTLWTEYADGMVRYRHLERHEPGAILHGLYRGTIDNVGRQVPLQDRPETEHLALLVNADGAIPTGIQRLTASYNLNMPTRAWRKRGELSDAGRSDFAGIQQLFDALDETWSSWIRSIKLSKARLLIPESYLDFSGPGKASAMDPDQEIFSPVAALAQGDVSTLQLHQPTIPVEQHEATCYALYREILRAAGYSPSAWGDYGGNVQTATEVSDRSQASERTRDKKALYDKDAIGYAASVALELDGILFPGQGGGLYDVPNVEFPSVSQQDPEKMSRTLAQLRAASAVSTETAVQMFHPDWDEPRVKQEVDGIIAEQGRSVLDPATLPG